MNLQEIVRDAFEPGSQLARQLKEFRPRPEQTEMAVAIARTVEDGGVLVVEAGTGVGKTFSYLVPALMSGERVLLSTATKNLQDQLFGRDLPLLVKALGLPVRTALLKGRASYLCMYRLEIARQEIGSNDRFAARTLAAIEKWSQSTYAGDLAELPGLDERSAVIPLVTSTRENCLGSQCPQFRPCHVNLARREAMAADVVVINHHLFFADMAVRESGVAELLPSVNTVIFDEAHQLNEIGVQFLGNTLTTGQLLDFARDLLAAGLTFARGLVDWHGVAVDVETAARELRLVLEKSYPGAKLRWTGLAPEGVNEDAWREALSCVNESCVKSILALDGVGEIAPDFARLVERAGNIAEKIESFKQPCAPGAVRWLDVGAQLRLVESPLDIAKSVQDKLLKVDEAQPARRAWIFTSATLGDDARLKKRRYSRWVAHLTTHPRRGSTCRGTFPNLVSPDTALRWRPWWRGRRQFWVDALSC
jgi:ATP-dependent DNA helicase DinG